MRSKILGVALAVALAGSALAEEPAPSPAPAAAPAPAAKAKTPTVAELAARVDALEAEVRVAAGGAADAAATRQAVTELEAKMTVLEGELGKLHGAGQLSPEDRAVIDKLATRVPELERALNEVRAQAALTPQPSAGGAGTDGGPVAGYDDGFFLRSPDGRFTLVVNGWLKLRYQLDRAGAAGGQSARITRSGFSVNQARLGVSGVAWSSKVGYAVSFDVNDTPILRDAWADWQLAHGAAVLRVGQLKVPFSREALAPDDSRIFADPSVATQNAPLRDIGAVLYGHLAGQLVRYQASVVNGSGPNVANENIDLSYAARVAVTPLGEVDASEGDLDGTRRPRLELSAAGRYDLTTTGDVDGDGKLDDVDGDGRSDNTAVMALDAALAARWRGAAIEAELILRREDEGVGRPIRTLRAWFAQGSYAVPRLHGMAGVRYGEAEPTPVGLSRFERAALPKVRREFTAMLGYTREGHKMKAQLELSLLRDDFSGGSQLKSARVLGQIQLGF